MASAAGDGGKRFELLETVRDYSRQKLLARSKAEATLVRERHADYYSAVADGLHPSMKRAFVGWVSTDPTVVTAHVRFQDVQHDLRDALAWLVDAQRPGDAPSLAVTLSSFWTWFGFCGQARRCLEPAMELG